MRKRGQEARGVEGRAGEKDVGPTLGRRTTSRAKERGSHHPVGRRPPSPQRGVCSHGHPGRYHGRECHGQEDFRGTAQGGRSLPTSKGGGGARGGGIKMTTTTTPALVRVNHCLGGVARRTLSLPMGLMPFGETKTGLGPLSVSSGEVSNSTSCEPYVDQFWALGAKGNETGSGGRLVCFRDIFRYLLFWRGPGQRLTTVPTACLSSVFLAHVQQPTGVREDDLLPAAAAAAAAAAVLAAQVARCLFSKHPTCLPVISAVVLSLMECSWPARPPASYMASLIGLATTMLGSLLPAQHPVEGPPVGAKAELTRTLQRLEMA
ncbi:hypothetical protein F5X68DRAFT_2440 [Plectosphaerella plurivora]|uniref:Uncharacterized protein n=1 Tax=Plectosphaerella plurivora TaxID=936078 RepID=A0A9P8VMF3_9PEZI|nr:hypothetical protein F5X68DRAFT_2440 [Plectosphaerella plurivora]